MKISGTLLLLSISLKVFSCDCETTSLAETQRIELEFSDVVFLGEVISSNKQEGTFKLRVVELFKGVIQTKEVEGGLYDSCSKFISGEGQWIIYGIIENGKINVSQCGVSRSYTNPHMIMSSSYPPASPRATEKQYQGHMEKQRREAQLDWQREIEQLRTIKNK